MRKRLIPIFIIVFVNYLGATIVLPILPLYAGRKFDASPEWVTLLGASFFAAQFIAGPILGRISDRRGRVPVLIFSQIGTVISFIMLGGAESLGMMFASRILDGITGGNVIVAQAYITDVTPPQQRTRALGVVFAAFGLGFIFGPALGGFIASLWGDTAPFYVGAMVSLVSVILTWVMLDESLTEAQRLERRAQRKRMTLGDIWANSTLMLILGVGFVAQLSFSLLQSTFALYGEAVIFRGEALKTVNLGVGLLLTGIGIGQFATQLFLIKRLIGRYGEARLVVIGAWLRSFGMISLVVLLSPWLVGGISLIAFAVGSGIMMPSLQSLATVSVADEMRGGVLGVYNSATSLGVIFGSILGGPLFAQHYTLPFLIGGLLLAGIGGVFGAFGVRSPSPSGLAMERELDADLPG